MSELELSFTGERLHENDALFGVDLVRHRVAYDYAIRRARESGATRILELGSGTGYGASELSRALHSVVAIDRIGPSRDARRSTARFVRADLQAMPIASECFDLVVSFQVIEHLHDPKPYLEAMAESLTEGGAALVTTPNRLFSDGENPFHVHEYEAQELTRVLEHHFENVEMLGISARGEALAYHEERLDRIRRIVRIDPLRLRRVLPRRLIETLFAKLAVVVRRGIAKGARVGQGIGQAEGMPEVDFDDFPIEPAHPRSLDLLAVCRRPIRS